MTIVRLFYKKDYAGVFSNISKCSFFYTLYPGVISNELLNAFNQNFNKRDLAIKIITPHKRVKVLKFESIHNIQIPQLDIGATIKGYTAITCIDLLRLRQTHTGLRPADDLQAPPKVNVHH